MNENPFENSTLQTQPTAFTSPVNSPHASTLGAAQGVEVRYPAVMRTVVPGALMVSALIVPIILFFVLPSPLFMLIGGLIALMEFSTAGVMWFVFNAAFVRADASGITKSQIGQTKTLRWEEIGSVETRESTLSRPPRTEFVLKDAQGKSLLEFNDFGNRANGLLLKNYIEAKLEQRS